MKLGEAIEILAPHLGDAAVIMANGYISRAGHAIAERQHNFYMIGSMGLASSIGLGIALAQPQRRVVVFDGDGNVLMNLGGIATIAAQKPQHLHHIVFDNEVYASTGNQPTLSSTIELDAIAGAAGYARVARFDDCDELRAAAGEILAGSGPSFTLIKIEREEGTSYGRVALSPQQMTERMRASLA